MKEKTAFITGANKGIGFGIAKHLGLSGWRIIIGARNQERAEKAIREKMSALTRSLPRGQQIAEIIVTDEPLPRTATGKIKRWELQQKVSTKP